MVSAELELADLRLLTALTCQGRTWSHDQPTSQPCGRRFVRATWMVGAFLDHARVAGWRVGHRADGTPDAMCPSCGRSEPSLLNLRRELATRGRNG